MMKCQYLVFGGLNETTGRANAPPSPPTHTQSGARRDLSTGQIHLHSTTLDLHAPRFLRSILEHYPL